MNEPEPNCPVNPIDITFTLGRENESKFYIFWPYTQFKQDTIKSIPVNLDIGTTKVNVLSGPTSDQPVYKIPGVPVTIALGIEVLDRSNQSVSGIDNSNFILSIEKNQNGQALAIATSFGHNNKYDKF